LIGGGKAVHRLLSRSQTAQGMSSTFSTTAHWRDLLDLAAESNDVGRSFVQAARGAAIQMSIEIAISAFC
jgi:hypothetical protein